MHTENVPSDPGASQGARRATEDAPGSAPSPIPPGSDSEVVPRARRRTFTSADKRRILQAADRCTLPGEVGALISAGFRLRLETVFHAVTIQHNDFLPCQLLPVSSQADWQSVVSL